jgi:hypothetical protein
VEDERAQGPRVPLRLPGSREARAPARDAARHRKVALALLLVAALVAGDALARPRRRRKIKRRPPPIGQVVQDKIAGGDHWRLVTEHGIVHVFRPKGYRAETAGLVVYVHGYYTNVDGAWTQHHLADQFVASQQNALFVVPEAPDGNAQSVFWTSLGELITESTRMAKLVRPPGPLVAVAHSGGFRTLVPWLDYHLLDCIILLDALYGNEDDFRVWLDTARGNANKLVLVAADTIRWTEPLVEEMGDAVEYDRLPRSEGELDDRARTDPFLYYRAQYGHMELVESGKVVPLLLQIAGLEKI